jgi:tRNA pseudouridine55 synthase
MNHSIASVEQFLSGMLLTVDKPYGWTSFDAVNRIKHFVKKHKLELTNEHGHKQRFKIGHAGTLDPLATGLLIFCTGKMTSQIDQFQAEEKVYTGNFVFGKTTPSFDLETEPTGSADTSALSLSLLNTYTTTLTGKIMQRPPAYSAKQINGQRAYKAARRGIDIEIPLAEVQVFEFEITQWENPVATFMVRCSKGTYIRSLANDIGKIAGTGAYLSSLRRTHSGQHTVNDAWQIDDLLSHLESLITADNQRITLP